MAKKKTSTWVRRWPIQSQTNPGETYTVAEKEDGSFGCSCKAWIFQRNNRNVCPNGQCKHIQLVLSKEVQEQVASRQRAKRDQKFQEQETIRIQGWLVGYEERDDVSFYAVNSQLNLESDRE